jgi:hypothetical protein
MKTIAVFSLFMLIGFTSNTLACFPECHPDYAEWVSAGMPSCWCYPRQCKGDTDGGAEGNIKTGFYYIGLNDLSTLVSTWAIKEPPQGPGLGGAVCADFDHRVAGSIYTGYYRINPQDICILAKYWRITEPPRGPGVDPNCGDCQGDPRGMEGPTLSIWTDPDEISGFGDYDELSIHIGQPAFIGIQNSTSDFLKWYDGYLIMTEGLENGSWTGGMWTYSTSVEGWTYYGTSPILTQDAWFAKVSLPSTSTSEDPELISAWLEYVHEGLGDTTISLYNEYYELQDTLVITSLEDMILQSPNGGEVWNAGQVYEILWETKPDINDITIEYSINGGTDWLAVSPSNVGNTGSYMWLTPDLTSTQCVVRISDTHNPSSFDQSDAVFTILQPDTSTVVQPNGGERLVSGSAYPIRWSSTGLIENVKIEYTISDGAGWQTITSSTDNDGDYLWDPVPDANSPDCRIRVTDVLSDANDVSDELFTIFKCLIGPIPGDINEDCYVDLEDLAIMSRFWLICGNPFDMGTVPLVQDDFNNGSLDSRWEISLFNASDWAWEESGTELQISDINPITSDWAAVELVARFPAVDNYVFDAWISWDSDDSLEAVQKLEFQLREDGDMESSIGYRDTSVSSRGFLTMWCSYGGGWGPSDLPHAGSIHFRMVREQTWQEMYWGESNPGGCMYSEPVPLVNELVIRIETNPQSGGFLGTLSIDRIQLTSYQNRCLQEKTW